MCIDPRHRLPPSQRYLDPPYAKMSPITFSKGGRFLGICRNDVNIQMDLGDLQAQDSYCKLRVATLCDIPGSSN